MGQSCGQKRLGDFKLHKCRTTESIHDYVETIATVGPWTTKGDGANGQGWTKSHHEWSRGTKPFLFANVQNQLAAALAINSQEEYTGYLKFYAQKLVEEGAVAKAAELLDDLYFGRHLFAQMEEIERHQMLRDLIPTLGKARSFQRITAQVTEALGI